MSVDSLTTPARTTFTAKKQQKRKPTPASWRPGESGNPKGRPKDDESWSGIIRRVGNMTSDEIVDIIGVNNDLGREIAKYPKNVQMKWVLILRVFASQMFDPNGVMFRELMDRLEGRVPFRAEVDGKLEVTGLDQLIERVYGEIVDGVVAEPAQLEDGK